MSTGPVHRTELRGVAARASFPPNTPQFLWLYFVGFFTFIWAIGVVFIYIGMFHDGDGGRVWWWVTTALCFMVALVSVAVTLNAIVWYRITMWMFAAINVGLGLLMLTHYPYSAPVNA
jgi:hypothetical protein